MKFEYNKHIKLTLKQTLKWIIRMGDYEAMFLKQMDRIHNLETIEGLKPEKQRKMAEESNKYLIKLIAIIGDKLNIHSKMHLENKMFKNCHNIMKKRKK